MNETEAKPGKKTHEFYGDTKYMPQDLLCKKLEDAQRAVTEFTTEQTRRKAFTSTELLADRLHRLLHFQVDCDYHYSDWPIPNGCRSEFHSLAKNVEHWFSMTADPNKTYDYPLGQVVALMEALRFGRYY